MFVGNGAACYSGCRSIKYMYGIEYYISQKKRKSRLG